MSTDRHSWPRLIVRLPPDVKEWIALQARRNASSQTSEVVRSIKERMERNQPSVAKSQQ